MFARKLCMLCACAALSVSCHHARVDIEPVSAVEITSAPVGIEASPSVVYGGRLVYWYENHWYFREGDAWHYYVEEPRMLRHHRRHWYH